MVGLSASWNVSGPQSGRAVISSDWLTEMKSFPAFLVCSLIAICTCAARPDRKSTRLNSSHLVISYAVLCLKKKKKYKDYYLVLSDIYNMSVTDDMIVVVLYH